MTDATRYERLLEVWNEAGDTFTNPVSGLVYPSSWVRELFPWANDLSELDHDFWLMAVAPAIKLEFGEVVLPLATPHACISIVKEMGPTLVPAGRDAFENGAWADFNQRVSDAFKVAVALVDGLIESEENAND